VDELFAPAPDVLLRLMCVFPKRAVHAVRTHVTVAPLTFVMKIFVCPDVADGKWLVKQGWQQLIGDKSRNGIVDVLIVETPNRHIVAGKCRQSLVCGMQVYGTVALLGPGQDAKAYLMGTFWGFSTMCDAKAAKRRVRLVSSEPLWVFSRSVELRDADVANVGYFLNFRCDASELSAHSRWFPFGLCV